MLFIAHLYNEGLIVSGAMKILGSIEALTSQHGTGGIFTLHTRLTRVCLKGSKVIGKTGSGKRLPIILKIL